MKKICLVVFLMGMLLGVEASVVYGASFYDAKWLAKEYNEYKAKTIKEIEDKLVRGHRVYLSNYRFRDKININDYPVLSSREKAQIDKYNAQIDKYREDLNSVLDTYKDRIAENNAFYEQADEKFDNDYVKLISKGSKYYPNSFSDLSPEEQQILLNRITGGRVLFKREWRDLGISGYAHLRRAIFEAGQDPSNQNIREALNWIIYLDCLYYLGYINRVMSEAEYYSFYMEQLAKDRYQIIRNAERERWNR